MLHLECNCMNTDAKFVVDDRELMLSQWVESSSDW